MVPFQPFHDDCLHLTEIVELPIDTDAHISIYLRSKTKDRTKRDIPSQSREGNSDRKFCTKTGARSGVNISAID